jgi:hypothetical protein
MPKKAKMRKKNKIPTNFIQGVYNKCLFGLRSDALRKSLREK